MSPIIIQENVTVINILVCTLILGAKIFLSIRLIRKTWLLLSTEYILS